MSPEMFSLIYNSRLIVLGCRMSNSSRGTQSDRPAALVHKRILDLAGEHPDASIDALADEIPAATPDLVERVLDDYGDPAGDEVDADIIPDDGAGTTGIENASVSPSRPDTETAATDPDVDGGESPLFDLSTLDLSDVQRETLRAVYENPSATQRELADELDVSAATVSTRLNDIDGFDWADRRAFVEELFGNGDPPSDGSGTDSDPGDATSGPGTNGSASDPDADPNTTGSTDDGASQSGPAGVDSGAVERIESRLAAIETELSARDRSASGGDEPACELAATLRDDPALLQKLVRLVVESDEITEEEERRLLEAVV
ncbi:hypothetical protein BRC83_09465 [Halobacteriales archaeon QS_1_68_17]|nr:MAG: hypothetical protein BRC83_09465 [Halobacteriales archaeon QS_1_68_17]